MPLPWWFWVWIALAVLSSILAFVETTKEEHRPFFKRGVSFWLAVAGLSLAVRLWKTFM